MRSGVDSLRRLRGSGHLHILDPNPIHLQRCWWILRLYIWNIVVLGWPCTTKKLPTIARPVMYSIINKWSSESSVWRWPINLHCTRKMNSRRGILRQSFLCCPLQIEKAVQGTKDMCVNMWTCSLARWYFSHRLISNLYSLFVYQFGLVEEAVCVLWINTFEDNGSSSHGCGCFGCNLRSWRVFVDHQRSSWCLHVLRTDPAFMISIRVPNLHSKISQILPLPLCLDMARWQNQTMNWPIQPILPQPTACCPRCWPWGNNLCPNECHLWHFSTRLMLAVPPDN